MLQEQLNGSFSCIDETCSKVFSRRNIMIRHYNRQHVWGDSTSAPCKICGTFECDGDHHGDHCDQAGTGDQMEVAVAHQRPVNTK